MHTYMHMLQCGRVGRPEGSTGLSERSCLRESEASTGLLRVEERGCKVHESGKRISGHYGMTYKEWHEDKGAETLGIM